MSPIRCSLLRLASMSGRSSSSSLSPIGCSLMRLTWMTRSSSSFPDGSFLPPSMSSRASSSPIGSSLPPPLASMSSEGSSFSLLRLGMLRGVHNSAPDSASEAPAVPTAKTVHPPPPDIVEAGDSTKVPAAADYGIGITKEVALVAFCLSLYYVEVCLIRKEQSEAIMGTAVAKALLDFSGTELSGLKKQLELFRNGERADVDSNTGSCAF